MAASLRRLAILLLAATLAACAGRPEGPTFSQAPKPAEQAEFATLYFYRAGWDDEGFGQVWFRLNDKPLFGAYERSFTWVQVPPGSYRVTVLANRASAPSTAKAGKSTVEPLLFEAEAGSTHYVRYERIPNVGSGDRAQPIFSYMGGVIPYLLDSAIHDARTRDIEVLHLQETAKATNYLDLCVYIENDYKP